MRASGHQRTPFAIGAVAGVSLAIKSDDTHEPLPAASFAWKTASTSRRKSRAAVTLESRNCQRWLSVAFMKIAVLRWCVLLVWIVAAEAETVKVETDPKSSELVEVQKVKLESLTSVTSVAISPDGRFLYAAAFNPGVINVFQRNIETGQIAFDSSIDGKDLQAAVSLRLSIDGSLAVASSFGAD